MVDAGAAVRDTSLFFCRQGADQVYAFEIHEERLKMARENIAMNHHKYKVTLFETPANAEQINQLHADFIKLDCEGCEYELLPELDLSKVSELVMEYHHKPDALLNVLRENGFATRLRGEIISATRK